MNWLLIGIRSRGVHLARRMARKIGEMDHLAPPVGVIDVTPYRDDEVAAIGNAGGRGFRSPSRGRRRKVVVLIDDVIFRGRTIRAAMEAVERLGRPKRILVAALDRSRRPGAADPCRHCR